MAMLAAPAIGAGVGLGASWLGSKIAGRRSPEEQQALGLSNQAQQQGINTGSQLMSLAPKTYGPVIDYYSRLLSGNRGEMTQALAPEINQIGEGYGAQTQAAANLMPRGGGRATMLQNLPYQQTRDVQSLMQTARPQAAGGLLQAGNAAVGQGIQALYGSTGAGQTILQNEAARRKADRELGGQLGQGIYSLFQGTPGQGNSLMDQLTNLFSRSGPGYSSPGGSRPRY